MSATGHAVRLKAATTQMQVRQEAFLTLSRYILCNDLERPRVLASYAAISVTPKCVQPLLGFHDPQTSPQCEWKPIDYPNTRFPDSGQGLPRAIYRLLD